VVIATLCILIAAATLRFANIGWSYSNNGIDEGVMIERVLMVDHGLALYSELPCDQAPMAFIVGSLFGGDVVSLRALTAMLSFAAVACCMVVSRRIGGNYAMLATGALLAVDFAFVRESRLFSLDAMATSFLAFSLAVFMLHLERRNLAVLALAGVLAGIACSMKLIGGLALLAIIVFILIEALKGRMPRKTALMDIALVASLAALPLIILMAVLGANDMIQGMVLDQGHREFDAFLKLSLLAYFGLNLAFVLPLAYANRLWSRGPRERLLLTTTFVILAFMIVQPLVFLHHVVIAGPALAILAGVVIGKSIEAKKASVEKISKVSESKWGYARRVAIPAFVISIVISGSLSTYGLATQGEPSQVIWGEVVAQLSSEGDYVICGDPIIAAYAGRMTPPEMVNVAERQYPELTLERLCQAVTEYDVAVVVVCYYLNDFEGFPSFLESHNYTSVLPERVIPEGRAVLDLYQDGIDPVMLYVRSADA
ncbi:MAG: phospholipid carrier-dependent glycosyltransferase, partial [Candidatus Thermoplasmatota archaeon]|nr:phospholipid carrier-dependent glycosyltransferase [Candidatus Thermoplasmatota archaeon]